MPERRTDRISILLVDDDEEDYLLTKELLPSIGEVRHEVQWAPDYRSALTACTEDDYDVCLIDYRIGPDDGIQLVRELTAAGYDMPMIVLTGQGDRKVDVQAAEAGAADYLVKGEISPTLLERTIRYAIRSHADMRALRESEAMLRQTQRLEAVGQLAGGVAHDFNNMLSAVVGFSELALDELADAQPARGYLEQIRQAGHSAISLTRQLLAFSRRQVLQTRVLDLNDIVGDVEGLLQRLIADDVELCFALDPQLSSIEADPGQLGQVIMNLAINARDAMPAGGRVTIETANIDLDEDLIAHHSELEPGPHVMLSVADTGVGMDDATLSRAFEPFFTTKEVGKGTGLGLSTVFGIVKQSGGEIELDSAPGRGTTVRIYLPGVDGVAEKPGSAGGDERLPHGRETILLVDNNELVRAFEREVLSSSGYTVLEAHGPRHAIELAGTHSGTVDLLLTDVVMPELSGRELALQIAAKRPGMRTLYTSGYASDAIVQHGVLEPGIAFLAKPLSRASLALKVREVLDAPSAGS